MNCDDDMEVKILVQGAPGGSGRFPVMSDRQTAQSELCCETLSSGNVLIELKNRRKHFMNTRNQKEIDFRELVDIKDVVIDSSLDKEKRIESFKKQIKNPLCFKCGEYVVQVSFSENHRTIEDCFGEYLKNL